MWHPNRLAHFERPTRAFALGPQLGLAVGVLLLARRIAQRRSKLPERQQQPCHGAATRFEQLPLTASTLRRFDCRLQSRLKLVSLPLRVTLQASFSLCASKRTTGSRVQSHLQGKLGPTLDLRFTVRNLAETGGSAPKVLLDKPDGGRKGTKPETSIHVQAISKKLGPCTPTATLSLPGQMTAQKATRLLVARDFASPV